MCAEVCVRGVIKHLDYNEFKKYIMKNYLGGNLKCNIVILVGQELQFHH